MLGESFFCPFIVIASPPCRAVIPRACGGSSTPRLLGSITDVSGILGRPVKPGDDTEDVALAFAKTQLRNPAARCARVVHEFSAPKRRGRRECRVRAAPAVSCAKLCEETHTSIQVQRKHSGIPRAMALRLIPRSPRRRILVVTVAVGLMVTPIRSDRCRHRQLDTSNGCQNHTVLPYAATSFVLHAVARSRKPPCKQICAPTLPRPPHLTARS
jgi:hypothetical protein